MGQRMNFLTDDGVHIAADWTTAPTTVGAAILVHMHPSTKESWASFQQQLARRGIASLAIDLRGHGDSRETEDGRMLDYRSFSDEENRLSIQDLTAAYEWIRGRGIDQGRIAVVGASIGANLALRLLAEEPTMPCALLLSPGISYHGVDVMDITDYIVPEQSVYIVASSEDDDESVDASEQIMDALEIDTKIFKRLKHAGHGSAMIESDAVLMGQLADWLRDRIQNFSI